MVKICSHFLFYKICKSGGGENRIFEYLRYKKGDSAHDQKTTNMMIMEMSQKPLTQTVTA